MEFEFSTVLNFSILALFILSIIFLVSVSSLKKDVAFNNNCAKPFSIIFGKDCNCINDCGISLICKQLNYSRKCVNVLSDYLIENNLTAVVE